MSRRVQSKLDRTAVINYVGQVVCPTYATDMERYVDMKKFDRVKNQFRTQEESKTSEIPEDVFSRYIDPAFDSALMKLLVTSSAEASDIQLQLDSATLHLFHRPLIPPVLEAYRVTNHNAPVCLIPHRALPIVLQGWIERHEDGGEFDQGADFDVTYEEFQSNNFCKPPAAAAPSRARYRLRVEHVHYRGAGTYPPHIDPRKGVVGSRPRDEVMREMISAMEPGNAKQTQLKAADTAYDDLQLRQIRKMFDQANDNPQQAEFYEWNLASPSTVPMFLKVPPQAQGISGFESLNNDLGIQFPSGAATEVWGGTGTFTIGFRATDFVDDDSNVFFAALPGWQTPAYKAMQPWRLHLPHEGAYYSLPVALVNTLPYVEDEEKFEGDEDDRKLDEWRRSREDKSRSREMQQFIRMMQQQTKIWDYNRRQVAEKTKEKREEQRETTRNQLLESLGRQPTALELAQKGVLLRTALFPARFANRVNYRDPKFQKRKATDRRRADILLDFVYSYHS